MEQEEQLKGRVLARARGLAPAAYEDVGLADGDAVFIGARLGTEREFVIYGEQFKAYIGIGIPASDPVWALVAPILGIETIDPPLA